MKVISKIFAINIWLWSITIQAQTTPNGNTDCHPDGPFISTAPVTYTGQSYQTNTWDWTQQHLPSSNNTSYVAQSQLNNNPLPAGLENPFYQLNRQYLSAIAGGSNSDFYPADGWELIFTCGRCCHRTTHSAREIPVNILALNMQNGIEFFTSTCLNWIKVLEHGDYKAIITDSLRFLVEDKRIYVYGFVIMPNHIHLLWAKQEGWLEKNVAQMFMKFTAQQIKFKLIDEHSPMLDKFKSTQSDRDYHFWERRPFVATMNNRDVLLQKLDYIHNNSVGAGLTDISSDYKYSSAGFYLGQRGAWTFLTHYTEHI